MSKKFPLWGNFIFHADEDLLSFALLMAGGEMLMTIAMYHAVQAIEKYFKAVSLSIIDPDGISQTAKNNKWLRTHDLTVLANCCGKKSHFIFKKTF